jgi:D-inositol-3-phosphate glycosyltransferase
VRIAMISEHASPLATLGGVDTGGQNAHVAGLAAALARLGHEVRVYTRRDAVDLPPVVRTAEGVEVVHVPAGPAEPVPRDELLPYMREFGRWLAARWHGGWTPRVVHAHSWMSGLAAVWAGRRCAVPVVQTYHTLGTVKRRHQGAADTGPPGRIGYERALGRTARRVVAQCRHEVTELVAIGVPPARIRVVPSGVDLDRFQPDGPAVARPSGNGSGPPTRVLAVGRLVERKGYQDLVRALPALPDVELVVVGGPPAAGLPVDPVAHRLRELAGGHRVADRLHLVGAVPLERMPHWYRSADIVACTPWYEPFGLTPLEAMACGTPVVASAVGGLTDTVADRVTGVLVPPRDPDALAAALRELAADPWRRLAYGEAGLERVRRRYSWRHAAERLAALYTEVAGAGAARRPAARTAVG